MCVSVTSQPPGNGGVVHRQLASWMLCPKEQSQGQCIGVCAQQGGWQWEGGREENISEPENQALG